MTPDDLLLQVLLNPADESLRAVYVDQLLERGDPRGEHARLVRQGRGVEAEALAARHASSWVPAALAPHVVSARFRDGLLDACELRDMSAHEATQLASDPLWSVVRELINPPAELITQATALERLERVNDQVLAELAGWQSKLGTVRHLGLRVTSVRNAQVALRDVSLPALESLSVNDLNGSRNGREFEPNLAGLECCEECGRGAPPEQNAWFEAAQWKEFFAGGLGVRLRTLEFHVGWVELGPWLAAYESTRLDVERLSLRGVDEAVNATPKWKLTLHRTAPGRYRALELERDADGELEEHDVRWILRTMPDDMELVGPLARRARRLRA